MASRRKNIPSSAADLIPSHPTRETLRKAAAGCRACPLWKLGQQTVFGEGPSRAKVLVLGEQPGFQEDIQGHPFVGPAGKLLDKALVAAGLSRQQLYITNVVKHFKWKAHEKRHMHDTPNSGEIAACLPWLHAELAWIKPEIILCLGATAAQALLGKQFRVTKQRGQFFSNTFASQILATVHPSSLLRIPDEDSRQREIENFIADLKIVGKAVKKK